MCTHRVVPAIRDVVSSLPSPDRSLSVALVCFAVAGLANAPLSLTPRAGLALVATVLGAHTAARYARSADRLRLVRTALSLWVAVIAVAAIAAIGGGVGYGPLPAGIADEALRTATWAALLGAGATTAFLGFREYGGRVGDPASVEGEIDY